MTDIGERGTRGIPGGSQADPAAKGVEFPYDPVIPRKKYLIDSETLSSLFGCWCRTLVFGPAEFDGIAGSVAKSMISITGTTWEHGGIPRKRTQQGSRGRRPRWVVSTSNDATAHNEVLP